MGALVGPLIPGIASRGGDPMNILLVEDSVVERVSR